MPYYHITYIKQNLYFSFIIFIGKKLINATKVLYHRKHLIICIIITKKYNGNIMVYYNKSFGTGRGQSLARFGGGVGGALRVWDDAGRISAPRNANTTDARLAARSP